MGWESLNVISVPFLGISLILTTWLLLKRRREAEAVA
jgi:LPXTG-motif cell wall-anchored protein